MLIFSDFDSSLSHRNGMIYPSWRTRKMINYEYNHRPKQMIFESLKSKNIT